MRTFSPDLRAWVLVMVVQSVPYLSAVIAALISALPIPASWVGHGYTTVVGDEEFATIIDAPAPAPTKAPTPEAAGKDA